MDDSGNFVNLVMVPSSGRGKEICERLRTELGIPKNAQSFEVRFAVNEPITVNCVYMPSENREA